MVTEISHKYLVLYHATSSDCSEDEMSFTVLEQTYHVCKHATFAVLATT